MPPPSPEPDPPSSAVLPLTVLPLIVTSEPVLKAPK